MPLGDTYSPPSGLDRPACSPPHRIATDPHCTPSGTGPSLRYSEPMWYETQYVSNWLSQQQQFETRMPVMLLPWTRTVTSSPKPARRPWWTVEGTATETLLKTRNSKPPSHQALQTTKKSPLWNIELFLAPLTTASVWNLQFKSVQKQTKNSIQGIFRNKHGSTRPSGRRDRLLTSTVAQNV